MCYIMVYLTNLPDVANIRVGVINQWRVKVQISEDMCDRCRHSHENEKRKLKKRKREAEF